jgi:predicted RNA-binding Zn ribbon-like protein
MRQAAGQSTQSGLEVLRRAISLREAIYRIITTFKTELPPQDADLAVLNHEFQIANQHRILAYTPEGWDWQWDENPQALDRILWPVAQSAANLLTSETLDRVGECQGEDCGWLFLDASKNKSRRWCSMDDCGNREKARQFYRRKKEKLDTP